MASALVGYNWPGSESTAGSRGLMGAWGPSPPGAESFCTLLYNRKLTFV